MMRVLIVEDSRTQAEELRFLLEAHDFDVAVESNGESGLARCKSERFDVVLSDVVMPGIDGYELCRRMKADPATAAVPVILLTSLADPLDIIHGLECGADNFITKPYDADYLVGRVQQLLQNRDVRAGRRLDVGVELVLLGKRFTVNSRKEQMLDLLISTFEEMLRSRHREYEAKVAEESHRQSHRLLQSALDALSAQIAIVDASRRIVAVNAAWRRMGDVCGWTWPASGVGEDYRDVLETAFGAAPDDLAAILAGVEEVRAASKDFLQLEYAGKVRGASRWFSLSATRFEGNGITLLALENEDVTEKRRAAEEVQASQEALQGQTRILNSILHSMTEGVVVADCEGKLLLANRRAEEMLGIAGAAKPAEWRPVFRAYLPDGTTPLPAEQHPMQRAIRGEETRDADLFCVNPSAAGGLLLAAAGAPLRDSAGRLTGGVVVVRDVTQQRKLEQQLRQGQKMEAMGQLAGGVAHDFNNLLSVILSYGNLLMRDLSKGDPQPDDLAQLLEAAKRAAALTRQLLAFSRQQVVQPTVLQLNDVVVNVEKMLKRIIGEDIDLAAALDPGLSRVKADAGQIEQILMNLSVNARDAMPRGGKLTIETANTMLDATYASGHASVKPGRYVELAVSDTGSGMSAETQARIFEPFFTTKEVGKGTGLGLWTVYGIVQQSGGHVWVYSEVGRGTTFKVYLPVVDELPSTVSTAAPARRQVTPTEKILLVDDDDAVRQVAARILRQAGYVVSDFKRADEARAICETTRDFSLLLTDVVMPETSGPELAVELQRMLPGLHILYMSGYSPNAAFRHEALKPGTAFLEKPFGPESLAAKVREALDTAN